MTIKVAKDGYSGTVTMGGGVMLINGVLHEVLRPVNRGEILWVPVRSYDGPVEQVDRSGRPVGPMSKAEIVARQLAADLGLPGAKR